MHDKAARVSSLTTHPSPLLSEVLRQLLRFLVPRVLLAEPAVLAQLEALGRLFPVLRRAVIPALTVEARQRNNVPHISSARCIGRFEDCETGRFRNLPVYQSDNLPIQLRQYLRYRARAHRAAAFANREA